MGFEMMCGPQRLTDGGVKGGGVGGGGGRGGMCPLFSSSDIWDLCCLLLPSLSPSLTCPQAPVVPSLTRCSSVHPRVEKEEEEEE